MTKFIKLFATFFYLGEVPLLPGTIASFAGLLLFVCISFSKLWVFGIFFLLLVAGFFVSGRAEKMFGKKDPGQIVIDEVAGIFLTFLNVPIILPSLIIGFLLFRFFDIAKPFPVRRLEKLPGSLGIMADDLACGIYANFILQLLFKTGFLKV